MTVVMFVVMLTIPVLMVARNNRLAFVLIGVWGFFLGMTPAGPQIADVFNQAGAALAQMVPS